MLNICSKLKTCNICYDENIKKNCNTCECKKGIIVCNVCWDNIEHDNIRCPLCKTPLQNKKNKCDKKIFEDLMNCIKNNFKNRTKITKILLITIGYLNIPYLVSYILFLLYCDTTCNIIKYYKEDIHHHPWFLLWNWLVGISIIAIFKSYI